MIPIASNPDLKLEITRLFDAPRRLVFEAWTKPKHLIRWCAPTGFTIPESEGDIRPGGSWRSCMVAPNGEEHRLVGVYREIVQDELIVFTHQWLEDNGQPGHETVVTVRLEDEGARTKMFFLQEIFSSKESRDGHAGGWAECLDRLESLLRELK